MVAFLGAVLVKGAPLVVEASGFDQTLKGADLVFTGEGRVDEQTAFGKAPGEVAKRAKRARVPVVLLAGGQGPGWGGVGSGEGRGGEEGRSRWGADHLKKKKKIVVVWLDVDRELSRKRVCWVRMFVIASVRDDQTLRSSRKVPASLPYTGAGCVRRVTLR